MRGDSDGLQQSPSSQSRAPNGSPPSMHKNGASNGVNGSPAHTSNTNGTSMIYTNGASNAPPSFYGHDREEVARILIQGLQDLGYHQAATSLRQESGYEVESPHATAFRIAVLSGEWPEAERLLVDDDVLVAGDGSASNPQSARNSRSSIDGFNSRRASSLTLPVDANKAGMLFLIRRQKYLELLEQRDIAAALLVLQQELHPLHQEQRQLHALSSLIMCQSADDLKNQAEWDGAQGESRKVLLSDLSRSISPSVMIPERRLASLFDQLKESQMHECVYHNTRIPPSLYTSHVCSREDFPLEMHTELDQHSHEVWFCAFSNDGTRLATASKDKSVIIYDTTAFRVKHVLKEHRRGVAYVAWSPDDSRLLSCSLDFEARLWDTKTGRCVRILKHHTEPVTSASWAPDGKSFVTGSLCPVKPLSIWSLDASSPDQSPIHTFDNCERVEGCALANVSSTSAAARPSFDPDNAFEDSDSAPLVRLVAFCVDKTVHIFDYYRREKLRHITLGHALTCLSLSRSGQDMLINLNSGEIWVIGVENGDVRQKFSGQQQGQFMIRSAFGGATEGFIVSGGEDGKIRVWHRYSGRLIEELDGHRPICVNAVSWNKANPDMFASASDDSKVRIWARPHPGLSQAQVLEQNRRSHNMFPANEDGNGQDLPRWNIRTSVASLK